MSVCGYVCECLCVCVSVRGSLWGKWGEYANVHEYVCMYVYVPICKDVCAYMVMCVHNYIYEYILCVHIWIYTYTYIYLHKWIYTYTNVLCECAYKYCMSIHMCDVCACMCICRNVHMYISTWGLLYTYVEGLLVSLNQWTCHSPELWESFTWGTT